ncbi:MAG: hypothetical protein E7300_07060 [Lachnospiraceae bacterium]|nr:hypothetical protein [Lachnospiraceae bacterium]
MRRNNKEQCLELIRTLEEAHAEIRKYIEKNDVGTASALLGECQDAAVSIGNIVEASEGEGTEAVKSLEEYCELVFMINEEIHSGSSLNAGSIEKKLRKSIIQAGRAIRALPTKRVAVFLPYKASMWDSLESIWMAADADPDCDAYVIPIPYYEKDPNGGLSLIHYEDKDFPDYVPITFYEAFDFEKIRPDMIFIHNPYDEYNYVTSVHPNFYSYNLKKYTDCLVYVPYYATAGAMGEAQAYCPSYLVVDHIVVQSKDMIAQFDRRVPREKFLALGSPKFDSVIRKCEDPPAPPADWIEKLSGKRVFFYNTSLGGLLDDTESFLKKMKYVFDTFKEVDSACLLWRPHPLFESTLDSMRSEYRAEYDRIKARFLDENIGIYDTTPDIESTIALCDAYIGDTMTSVTSLFEAAGKAVFVLDNRVIEKPEAQAWRGMYAVFPSKDMRFNKAAVMPDDKLFWTPHEDLQYEFFCDLPKDKYHWGYCMAFSFGGNIHVLPRNAQEILIISEDTKEIRHIELEHYDIEKDVFDRALMFGEEYAILIPNQYPDIVRYSFKTGKIDYAPGIRDRLWTFERGEQRLCACGFSGVCRETLFLIDGGNTLLRMNLDTLEITTTEVGFGRPMLVMISEDWTKDEYFWFLPYDGTEAIRWEREKNTFKTYDLQIDGLYAYNTVSHYQTESYYFSSIAVLDGRVIFAPRLANKFVELDLKTGKVSEWVPPFKVYMENKGPHYVTWDRGWFVWNMSGKACGYSNSPERITYDLDFEKNAATPVVASISEADIAKQYCKGFSSESRIRPVSCEESPWNTLYDIATDHITGNPFKPSEQKAAFLRINAHGDGKCGERIYKTLVKRLI